MTKGYSSVLTFAFFRTHKVLNSTRAAETVLGFCQIVADEEPICFSLYVNYPFQWHRSSGDAAQSYELPSFEVSFRKMTEASPKAHPMSVNKDP